MKYATLLLLILFSITCFSQSKKEEIALLKTKIDSMSFFISYLKNKNNETIQELNKLNQLHVENLRELSQLLEKSKIKRDSIYALLILSQNEYIKLKTQNIQQDSINNALLFSLRECSRISAIHSNILLKDFVNNYITTLQNKKIKLVDNNTCKKTEISYSEYQNGTLVYHVKAINIIHDSINFESKPIIYAINYVAENCWNGIGASNYLSNIFFVQNVNGVYKVDESRNLKFKQDFIDAINIEYKYNEFKTVEKDKFINDVIFKEIKEGKLYGEFAIIQCGATPCLKGEFEYDFKKNEIILKRIKNNFIHTK